MMFSGVRGAIAAACLCACGSQAPGPHALFAPPGGTPGDDFYALPYPNDLWRAADGTLDLSTFPTNSMIVDQYVSASQGLDGFGTNAAVFFRLDGDVDPMSLPDAPGSIVDGASVYLVNIDKTSPDYGQKSPVIVDYRADQTTTMGPNRLIVRPYPGFPLSEATTYAAVITDRVLGTNGGGVQAQADFQKELDAANLPAYQPLLDFLGDHPDDVVDAAVFTTQHVTRTAVALRQAIWAIDAPTATDIVAGTDETNLQYRVYTGSYVAPNFQMGDVPYHNAPDGQIVIGADGSATIQRMETMRMGLSLPKGTMPTGGWPICIYAHGTGGDYLTFTEDGTAARLAAQGIAVISTDQVLHGPRNPGGDPELDFFNFANPYAARDNALQGSADAFSQFRLASTLSIVTDTYTATFDLTNVTFFGHSQGGLTGPPFVAFEPGIVGAVMSGTSGLLYDALLYKKEPVDIPSVAASLIRDIPLDEDNPTVAFAQAWVERSDSTNYAPLMVRNPPAGNMPKNIYQSEGFTDTYAPNPGIEAFATALGGDVIALPDEADVEGLIELRGRPVMAPPFSKNLNGATAALGQYKQQAGSDGHFVVFEIAAASKQSSDFLGTL
ncbi:MAG TPA: hypothetical protein VGM88_26735, partial [Kofleriaceae bacterium]